MPAPEQSMMPSPLTSFPTFARPAADGMLARGLNAAARMAEEELIVDNRSGISPAEMVESKLSQRLGNSSLPVSHLQTRGLLRAR
jgi:hypothetical protein